MNGLSAPAATKVWAWIVVFCAAAPSVVRAAELIVKPIRASGVEDVDWMLVPEENTIVLASGGQDVEVHVFVRGFAPQIVSLFQARLDCTNVDSGDSGEAIPIGLGCFESGVVFGVDFCLGVNEDHPTFLMANASSVITACNNTATCPSGDPGFFGCAIAAITGDSGPDTGIDYYAATFAYHVTPEASGTFTLGLEQDPIETLMRDPDQVDIPIDQVVSAFVIMAPFGGLNLPLADDRFDVNSSTKTCESDDDCKAGETGPDPQTVCRDGGPGDGVCYVARQRYLSIKPNPENALRLYAYRISLDTGAGGMVPLGYARQPFDQSIVGNGPDLFHVARIATEPHYRDWTALPAGYLTVGDCEISPARNYVVQGIELGLDIADQSNYTAPLALPTASHHGDVTGSGKIGDPPNGSPPSLADVLSILRAWQTFGNEPYDWLDVGPNIGNAEPNFVVNTADAFDVILAFQLNPYPGPAPADCP